MDTDRLIKDLLVGIEMVLVTRIPETGEDSTKLRVAQESINHWLGKMLLLKTREDKTKELARKMGGN